MSIHLWVRIGVTRCEEVKCEVRETAGDALPLGRTEKVGSGSLLCHSTSRDKPVSPQLWAYRPNLWVSSDPLKRERVQSHLKEILNLSQQEGVLSIAPYNSRI